MLGVAIIGAGTMGFRHAHAFNRITGVEITEVYNRSRAKAEKLASEFRTCRVADSIDSLSLCRFEIVVVAVSVENVHVICEELFEIPQMREKIFLIEKPIGLDLATTKRMNRLVKLHKLNVFVGLNRRSYSSTRILTRFLDRDPNANRFVLVEDQQDPDFEFSRGTCEQVCKSWMYANSIHMVDYVSIICRGLVTEVSRLSRYQGNFREKQDISAHLKFDSGDEALYVCHWNRPGPWRISVSSGNRFFDLDPLESLRYRTQGSRSWNPARIGNADFGKDRPGLVHQANCVVAFALNRSSESDSLAQLEDLQKSVDLVERIYA